MGGSCRPPIDNGPANRRPDHLSRATRPAAVFPRLFHGHSQVVSALVTSLRRARWAASHPVPADLTPHHDIIQDSELTRLRLEVPGCLRPARPLGEFVRNSLARDHLLQVLFLDPRKPL